MIHLNSELQLISIYILSVVIQDFEGEKRNQFPSRYCQGVSGELCMCEPLQQY